MAQTDPVLAWSSSGLKASRKFLSSARCGSQKSIQAPGNLCQVILPQEENWGA